MRRRVLILCAPSLRALANGGKVTGSALRKPLRRCRPFGRSTSST